MKKKFFFLFLLTYLTSFFATLCAINYVYPVAAREDGLYLIHQTAPDVIALLFFNIKTHQFESHLSHRFCPGMFQLLPQQAGFSFIDNGLFKVQYSIKRSPQIWELPLPLNTISAYCWKNSHHCFMSVENRGKYAIFSVTDNGEWISVFESETSDFLFPIIIGGLLFYIKKSDGRDVTPLYDICSMVIGTRNMRHLISFENCNIGFLHMLSEKEGFVLEHVSNEENCINFAYHYLYKRARWESKKLFTFSVPNGLLQREDEHGLYESVLPLIPYYHDNHIYYSDVTREGLSLFCYDCETSTTAILCEAYDQEYYFRAFFFSDSLWFGASQNGKAHVCQKKKDNRLIKWYI